MPVEELVPREQLGAIEEAVPAEEDNRRGRNWCLRKLRSLGGPGAGGGVDDSDEHGDLSPGGQRPGPLTPGHKVCPPAAND